VLKKFRAHIAFMSFKSYVPHFKKTTLQLYFYIYWITKCYTATCW